MCEPTLLVAATIGLTGATSLFSAGSQARAGERSARLTIWQSMIASENAVKESAAIFDEADYTSGALAEQFGMVTGANISQLGMANRAYQEKYQDDNRAGLELLTDTSRATIEQLSESTGARVDQALRSTRAYGLAVEIARKNAEFAMARGNVEEVRSRQETDRSLATTTSYFAANNMDPTYGSPLMLQAFGAAQGDADAKIIRAGALQDAATFQWEALSYADKAEEATAAAAGGIDSDYMAASRTLDAAGRTTQRNIDAGGRLLQLNLDTGFNTATIGLELSGRATARNIESTYRTAESRAGGVISAARTNATAATIAADNARKAGQYGAASTLLSTVSNWASLAMGGKLAPIGIKGI